MASMCYILLFVALASPCTFAQLSWPPLSTSGTCDNSLSGLLLSMFSSDSVFSTVVMNSISFVNSTFICKTGCQVAAQIATIKVYLFYGPKITDYQMETLENMNNLFTGGHWNKSRNTTCFFPGWTKNLFSDHYGPLIVNAYLVNGSYNLIAVEWPTQQEYAWLVCQMPYFATRLAKAFDNFSLATDGNVPTMIFVGHSLGAHLCGYTARRHTVLEITFLAALEPAGPLFSMPWRCQFGVGANDAKVVVGVYSDAGRFGSAVNVGIADYYANNGTCIQPGCTAFDTNPEQCTSQFLCSHMRALFFWCDAILFPGSIIGRLCPSSSAYASGMCSGYVTNDITVPPSTVGNYYFTTNDVSPFGLGLNGA